ncbi:PAS domain S-box protein [Mariprofundus erugo]|uniref:hybrid sensor histidine kinase/response regulator n=1 Tax=Mariprofundus erugo TaxID=2528639 RepID=UPI0010FEE1B5|nr:PAS domain S-box protein [Mariprofundus erugo]TLS76236.1 PAS domain S-box protein [Mariprofundus erugo]
MTRPTDEEKSIQHHYRLIEALSESERRYRELVNNLKEVVFQTDAQGLWTFLNPAWFEVTGFSVEESLNTLFLDYVYPDDRELNMERFKPLIERKKEYCRHVIRYRHKNGGFRWIEVFARLTLDHAGAVQGTTGTLTDITERKQAEEEAEQLQLKLLQKQKLESLGVLAGGIAHDFNNLLAAIMGHAAMAERKLPGQSMALQKHMQAIVSSSEKAADLCRQMLAYSGQGHLVMQTVDLSTLIEGILNIMEVTMNKGVILKLSLTEQLPGIEADPSQVQQVVMNLVTNANEAIDKRSGVIAIRTGVTFASKDYLNQCLHSDEAREGYFVFVEVSDTGCGMDAQTMKKVFDPFFTTKFTGRGLGMSAILGIVRRHHGALKAYSEKGQGSTFRVLFPAMNYVGNDQVHAESRPLSRYGAGVVLVVDDEEIIRDMAAMMLADLGIDEVLTASDGKEATEIYRRDAHRIVLVLLDLTMPRMDGEETFRQLRMINPDVKVILSSGYSEQSVQDRFAGKRLFGFLQKPYTPEAMQALVEQALTADKGESPL